MATHWQEFDLPRPRRKNLNTLNEEIFDFTGNEEDCFQSFEELRQAWRDGQVIVIGDKCLVSFNIG